jgi:PAS domain S-box-containing protein
MQKIFRVSPKIKLMKFGLGDFCSNVREKKLFFDTLLKKGKVSRFQMALKSKDKKPLWASITAHAVKDKKRKVLYFEGTIEDITGYKLKNNSLTRNRELLQSLLDNIPDAIYFKDAKNRLILVNKAHAGGLGLKPHQVVGRTDFDFFPRKQARKMFEDDNLVLKTGLPLIDKVEKTTRPNGTRHFVSTTKIPWFNKDGKTIGTIGITRDITERMKFEEKKQELIRQTVSALVKAVELRDLYTYGHAFGVASIAETIARRMGWSEERVLGMKMAGELHDIGKIVIPAEILSKPGKLTDLERKMVQEHCRWTRDILKDIKFPSPLIQAVYQHHERLDGSGYPLGISGDKIIIEARVLAVADVLEAMTLRRPYREALGLKAAIKELKEGTPGKYDGSIVEVVCKIVKKNNGKPFWLKYKIATSEILS